MESPILSEFAASQYLKDAVGQLRVIVLCDSNTVIHCLPKLPELAGFPVFVMDAAEEAKSLSTVDKLIAFMLEHRISRNDLLVNLGGGVVCDLGGFVASIYKRGIRCINIPTSLLAMVDAAIGGKTAVNFGSLRNMCGTFALPNAVLIFPSMLESLPDIELRSGMAEMLKHALLQNNMAFEAFIQSSMLKISSADAILQSAEFKKRFVSNDLHDKGHRQLLNVGHTTAHAIEAAFLKREDAVPHGFAVAAGLWIEAELAVYFGKVDVEFITKLKSFIDINFPKLHLDTDCINDVLQFMEADKKNNNAIVFCLPFAAGNVQRVEIDEVERIKQALIAYTHA